MADDTTKFAKFIAEKKLNAKRLLAVSLSLEGLTPDDRKIKLVKRQAKAGDTPPPAPAEGEKKDAVKPRSGRGVTPRALEAAMTGGPLSGPTKHRILRAVNALLEQKKAEKIDLRQLF